MRVFFSSIVGFTLVVVSILGEPSRVCAQSKSPKGPVVSQQLIDDVDNAISNEVVEKLKKEGVIATKPAASPPATTLVPAADSDQDIAADRVTAFASRAQVVLGSFFQNWDAICPEFLRSSTRVRAAGAVLVRSS
jgi:hypothetical protein